MEYYQCRRLIHQAELGGLISYREACWALTPDGEAKLASQGP